MINANNVLESNNTLNLNNDNKENKMNNSLSLTTEQTDKLVQLAKELNKSITATFAQVVDRGLYDVSYRHARNVREYREYKEWKKSRQ